VGSARGSRTIGRMIAAFVMPIWSRRRAVGFGRGGRGRGIRGACRGKVRVLLFYSPYPDIIVTRGLEPTANSLFVTNRSAQVQTAAWGHGEEGQSWRWLMGMFCVLCIYLTTKISHAASIYHHNPNPILQTLPPSLPFFPQIA